MKMPPALVLNADFQPLSYFPLSTLHWEEAVKAVYKETHTVVANYDIMVRSPSYEMLLPSVIATKEYIKVPDRVAFTKFNVFLRDDFTCQYCSGKDEYLTFDHVIPRVRGGKTNWENIVAACSDCNTKKGHKIMKPIREPFKPSKFDLMKVQKKYPPNYLHESWMDYLYWDTEIKEEK